MEMVFLACVGLVGDEDLGEQGGVEDFPFFWPGFSKTK